MDKAVPRKNIKEYAKKKSMAVGEKTIENKSKINDFLVDVADVFLFLMKVIRNTFSRGFEFH